MIRTYSDNAIMTKVRALYGKRLTENDYDNLLSKKTVGEVAAYLKKETCYAQDLQEVKEELVHRGQLENLVRRRPLDIYTRLLKYAYSETLFLRLYVMQNEIEQLLTAIRLLNAGNMDRYIITLPVHLARLMSFDLFAMAGARSFDELLNVLEHSDYYRVVGRFRPSGAHKIVDITTFEAALLTYYYQTALDIAARDYHGDTRENLRQLFYRQVAVHNLSVIFRMRYFLKSDRDVAAARMVRVEGQSSKLLDRLLQMADIREMQEFLAGVGPLRRIGFAWSEDGWQMARQMTDLRRRFSQRMFRFSTQPAVVVITYMTLLDAEINNVVNIIEGIRYGVPPAELKSLLSL